MPRRERRWRLSTPSAGSAGRTTSPRPPSISRRMTPRGRPARSSRSTAESWRSRRSPGRESAIHGSRGSKHRAGGDGAALRHANPRAPRGAHREHAPAARYAERAGHVRAGVRRAHRDVFRRQTRHRCAGGRGAGLPRADADADDVSGGRGRWDLVRDRPRARRRPSRRRRCAGGPCARHRRRLRAPLHARRAGGGRWLYSAMGGSGASLTAALTYSTVVFAGAVLIWVFNSLANVIRGTGNMAVPAAVTSAGAAALIPLSPCLIFGWGPFPRLGVAGGAVAVLAYYAVGSVALAMYLWTGRSVVRLSLDGVRFRWGLFRDILRVGAVAALITVQTNLTIAVATGLVGRFGSAAIAGFGTGSRLEYLLVPLVFGLGGPLVAMVGTNVGAGQRGRALRAAGIGAAIAAGLTELIGLGAALAPHVWLSLFDTDPAMLDAGSRYLHTVGPLYGLFGLGMALYFASQGAGRLLWPLLANLTRLIIAAVGGWLALRWSGELSHVFIALSAALAAFGLINAGAVATGAWFGPLRWPRTPPALSTETRAEHD